ncbi:TonB-dependent receptor [Derxia lacustris]|uniref:TonB-dependent receptor n=1 Tax=Derxia lacustris TaxID=764842 RepID=UPI00111BDC07|nr:TonB-dependent receptor [Derxia lacustris]
MSYFAPFRLSPLALLIAAGLAAMPVAQAADAASSEQLKAALDRVNAESRRLEAEAARLTRELQARGSDAGAATAGAVSAQAAGSAEAAGAAGAAAGAPAAAGGDAPALQAVTVRGRNRLAALKEVPASSSVVAGEELERLGADSMRDITRRAANVTRQNSSNARSADLSIRGIGRKGSSEAQDPNVVITIDGVPYAYSGLASWDFVDIDSVEVKRGPQGTFGGKNASIGGVNITTRAPSFTPSAEGSIRLGQRDALFATAALGGPVIDDLLAWRGTFYISKRRGEYFNTYDAGDSSYTDRNKLSGKLQFLLQPSSDFSARFIADLQPRTFQNDNGLNFFHRPPATYSNGTPVNLANDAGTRLGRRWFGQLGSYSYAGGYLNYDTGTQNQDEQRALQTGTRGLSAQLNWQLSDSTKLTSISAWRDLYFDARNDEGTPFDISTQGGGGVRYAQITQELKLTSALTDDLDGTAGLFFIRNRHYVDSKTGWGSDAGAWFANAGQYSRLDADAAGRYLLTNSLERLRRSGTATSVNKAPAIFGNLKWQVSDPLTLNVGGRLTFENRRGSNYVGIADNGFAPELNPSIASSGVALGGFDSYYNSGTSAVSVLDGSVVKAGTPGAVVVAPGTSALTTSTLGGSRLAQANAQANAAALKYFGVASWAALSNAQKRQLYDAQSIRKSQLGLLYNRANAEPFRQTQRTFTFSPSWKFSEEVTGYVSYAHAEKAAVVQYLNNFSATTRPEKSDQYEIGLKSTLLDRTLTLAADVFQANIRDYQQQAQVVDAYTTALNNDGTTYYSALTGNAPKVRARGLEVDAFYSGIPRTTLRLAAAWNDARYKVFTNSPQPPENAYSGAPAYRDLSGRTLPGASKLSANFGIDYRQPLAGANELFVDTNYAWVSRYNSDVTLSDYGWIGAYGVTDVGIGIGRRDRAFNVTLLGKNIFNTEAKAYGFNSGTLDTTARWIGLVVSGKI